MSFLSDCVKIRAWNGDMLRDDMVDICVNEE